MPTVTSPVVGVSLTEATTDKKFAVGTVVKLSDGGEAEYVSATSTISQYNAVVIDAAGGAVPVTTTNAATTKKVAFAQTSIASGYFGWVQRGGRPLITLAANCDDNVPLYTTATGGVLDDAIVTDGLILGVTSTVTISNATAVTCIAALGCMVGSGSMEGE